jgi:tetratricopeptide (TPR) repeat protein
MSLIDRQIANRILSPRTRKEELLKAKRALSDPAKLSSRELMETWIIVGKCYKFDKKPQLSEKAYLKAIEMVRLLEDDHLLGKVYRDLGDALHFCASYAKSIAYYRQAAEIFDRLNEAKELITLLSQMAYSFAAMGKVVEERGCLEEAIRHPRISPEEKAMFMERIALSLGASGEYEEAIEIYEKALALYEAQDFKRYWGERLVGLAQLYEAVGDIEAAKRTMERL